MSYANGQGRKILVDTTVLVAVVPNSIDFGSFLAPEFTGLCGMVKCNSAFGASLQFQFKNNAGETIVTSALAVGSGIVVNEFNPGVNVNVGLLSITSATPARVYLTGLPVR